MRPFAQVKSMDAKAVTLSIGDGATGLPNWQRHGVKRSFEVNFVRMKGVELKVQLFNAICRGKF